MTATTALPPILFEDEHVIAFDKPAGLLVAPDRWDKTAANLIQIVHQKLSPQIFNVHRLDRETSGVLVCTKTERALRRLCRDFEEHRLSKRYICLVRGNPPWADHEVSLRLMPDPQRPGHMLGVQHGGKPARTRFHVLETWRGYALVEAVPLTGRTHQIRVHLASTGHPLVADRFYGDGHGLLLSELKRGYKHKAEPERPLMGRLALHAESLTFAHPATGATMTVRAPYPHDFTLALKYLSRFAK